MKARRRARANVLQTLYELDFTDHDPQNALAARLEDRSCQKCGSYITVTEPVCGNSRCKFFNRPQEAVILSICEKYPGNLVLCLLAEAEKIKKNNQD